MALESVQKRKRQLLEIKLGKSEAGLLLDGKEGGRDLTTDQEVCGRLNENGPHRFMYLNGWPSIGGTVYKGSGDMALLKGVCHRERALRFQDPCYPQLTLSDSQCLCQDVRRVLLPHMLLAVRVMDSPSETVGPQLNFSSISYHGHGAPSQQ